MKKNKKQKKGKKQSKSIEVSNVENPLDKLFSSDLFKIILIFSVVLIIGVLFFQKNVNTNGDNTAYYRLGLSIIDGEYSSSTDQLKIPHTKYPPGWPFIIALSNLIFPNNILAVKIVVLILTCISAVLFYYIAKKFFNNTISVLLTIFAFISAEVIYYSSIMMSEIPALFFSILGIFFLLKADFEKPFFKNYHLMIAIFAFIYSFHIRPAQVVIIGGFFLFLLIESIKTKNWKNFIYSGIFSLLLIIPWQFRNFLLGAKSSFVNQFLLVNYYRPEQGYITISTFFERVWNNFYFYFFSEIPRGFITNFHVWELKVKGNPLILNVVPIIILVFICFGIYKVLRNKNLYFIGIIVIFSIVLALVWVPKAAGANIRFLIPVLPLLVLGLLLGIQFLLEKTGKIKKEKYWNLILLIPLVLLFIFNVDGLSRMKYVTYKNYPPAWQNYYYCGMWIKNNAQNVVDGDDILISCTKPGLINVWTGLYTCRYSGSLNPDDVLKDLEKKGVDFVILDQLGFSRVYRNLYPAIKKYPQYFKLLYKTSKPETYVFLLSDKIDLN